MKIQIKDTNGKVVDINPEDVKVSGVSLGSLVKQFKELKNELEQHKIQESKNAEGARELWQSVKR